MEDNKKENEEVKNEKTNTKEKNNTATSKTPLTAAIVTVALIVVMAILLCAKSITEKNSDKEKIENDSIKYTEYTMKGNALDTFDLAFLKLENEEKNKVYSPLSIKYALAMLNEGTDNESNAQIRSIIGDYKSKKYENSKNLSIANALFIKDSFKDSIKTSYMDNLKSNYNAEISFDTFVSPKPLNDWVKNKTFNLIDYLYDDISDKDFILVNALAIDMEWVNKIQPENRNYSVDYKNEEFAAWVSALENSGYSSVDFNNNKVKAKVSQIRANANKYDIVKELGEDKIRKEVGDAYSKWLKEGACGNADSQPSVDEYLDQYIKDLNSNYKQISSSTDFYFYNDEDVKVFAKDLKEYDGTTLEYIGIMPTTKDLKSYINDLKADDAAKLISNLKPIELGSFKEGVVTDLEGSIPLFKYGAKLNLKDDLKLLGITDIFDAEKADLSKMTKSNGVAITDASHKAEIEFSNDGIKAGAVTSMGGMGAAGCEFVYEYKVPVEKIDLTFDKPYLYFIIDKDTKEVWFTGTVYEPTKWESPVYGKNM